MNPARHEQDTRRGRARGLARSGVAAAAGQLAGVSVHHVPESAEPPSPREPGRPGRVPAPPNRARRRTPDRRGALRLPRHSRAGRRSNYLGTRSRRRLRRGARRRRGHGAGRPSGDGRPRRWSAAVPGAAAPDRGLGRAGPVSARPPGRLRRPGVDRRRPRSTASPTPFTTRVVQAHGWHAYADARAVLSAVKAAGLGGRGGQQHRFRHPADDRRVRDDRPGRQLRTVVRGGPAEAGSGDLRVRLRGPARRPGADPDGRRQHRPTPVRWPPAARRTWSRPPITGAATGWPRCWRWPASAARSSHSPRGAAPRLNGCSRSLWRPWPRR